MYKEKYNNSKKNVLLISFDFPFPPTGGSISRDYNLIKQLSRYYNIYWINRTLRGTVPQKNINEMEKYCYSVKVVEWNYPHSIKAFFKSVFTGVPYIISRFADKDMENLVAKVVNENEFDIIICDHIYLAQYIPVNIENKIPVIANNEDNGFTYYSRLADSRSFFRAMYAKSEWKKMLKYEVTVYNKYKNFITTSQKEKTLIEPYLDNVNIGVVRNGVDIEYFYPMPRNNMNTNIVFSSWLRYYPNEEAAIDFAVNVFPKIKESIKDAIFYIVGKEPSENVKKLENINGVIVTGEVSDIREYLMNADVAVVPIKVGGGTRLKILEAFAMGIPVVSTTLGAEGLEVKNGENIIISDDYLETANKIVELINDKNLSKKISLDSLKFVREKYDWNIIGKEMNDYLESTYSIYAHRNSK